MSRKNENNTTLGSSSSSLFALQLPKVSEAFQPPLLYHRLYNPSIKKYCQPQWETLHYRPSNTTATATNTTIPIPLELGGMLTIYPNLIEKKVRDAITNEILQYPQQESNNPTT